MSLTANRKIAPVRTRFYLTRPQVGSGVKPFTHMPRKRPVLDLHAPRSRPTLERQIVIRATIVGIQPAIWRTVRLPESFTLHQLHRILQLVFGWLDYHLYEFRVGGTAIEGPHPEAEGATTPDFTLRALKLKARSHFQYTYDFGDGWEHDLEVLEFVPMPDGATLDWSPRLIGGESAGALEDSGGPFGFQRAVSALSNPADPEHETYRAWAGQTYDPQRFDLWALDHALALASAWGAV